MSFFLDIVHLQIVVVLQFMSFGVFAVLVPLSLKAGEKKRAFITIETNYYLRLDIHHLHIIK